MSFYEIFQLLSDSSFVRDSFFFILLMAPLSAQIGVLITVRRMSGITGALSHALVLGVGLSFFLQSKKVASWFSPFIGALIVALLLMLLLEALTKRAKQRCDVIYNLVWAAGLSGGLLLIKLTPGYIDVLPYLFGNLLLIQARDLYSLLVLNLATMLLLLLQGRSLRLSSFDREFALSRGMKLYRSDLPFSLLCCLSIVTLSVSVGQLLVIAVLTIPAACALFFAKTIRQSLLLAFIFALLPAVSGLLLSLLFNLPSSSLIILLMVLLYLLLLPLRTNR